VALSIRNKLLEIMNTIFEKGMYLAIFRETQIKPLRNKDDKNERCN